MLEHVLKRLHESSHRTYLQGFRDFWDVTENKRLKNFTSFQIIFKTQSWFVNMHMNVSM